MSELDSSCDECNARPQTTDRAQCSQCASCLNVCFNPNAVFLLLPRKKGNGRSRLSCQKLRRVILSSLGEPRARFELRVTVQIRSRRGLVFRPVRDVPWGGEGGR